MSLDSTVADLMTNAMAFYSSSVAVEDGVNSLTYAQLDRRSTEVAKELVLMGAYAGCPVAIILERSIEFIVAVTGVVRSRCACIPIDPAYPEARRSLMLSEAGAYLLICSGEGGSLRVLRTAEASTDSCLQDVDPAYIIFTSGSSGRPKGVLIEQSALFNFIARVCPIYGIASSDRVLQFTSVSFDVSIEEIFATLTVGATLVLRTTGMIDSVREFLEECNERKISVLDLPTAFWHTIVAHLTYTSASLPNNIRLCIIAGECASVQRWRQWNRIVGQSTRLLNTYGMAEGTVVSTVADLTALAAHADTARSVPIGQPVPGVHVYIMNDRLEIVPDGEVGEICVSGRSLAWGYLNNSELTALRFVKNSLAANSHDVLYRTGDFGRVGVADGSYECFGRADQQVKIRGARVEIGEVEAMLASNESVADCAVLITTRLDGHKVLVAVVELRPHAVTTCGALRVFMNARLPAHSIPGRLLFIDKLPLTPNGKVDRERLKTWIAGYYQPDGQNLSHIESCMRDIWQRVLGLNNIGPSDNFYLLGGDSLAVLQLAIEAESIGLRVTTDDIIANPTLRELAMACVAN